MGRFTHAHRTTPPQANLGAAALLELSDSVRESLAKHGNFGPDADRLSLFLELAVFEEAGGASTIDFETIKVARLDKLVAELTEGGERPFNLPPRFVHDFVTAEKLEGMWRARFHVDYLMIDEIRLNDLTMRWQLKGGPGIPSAAKAVPRVGSKGKTQFKPGECVVFTFVCNTYQANSTSRWWPDMVCARHDGVVGTEEETTSRGDDNIATLPLLTGREINTGHGKAKYFREGTLADMHPALITQTGKHVRVLRGHLLRSHFAPSVGIQNDGLYVLL